MRTKAELMLRNAIWYILDTTHDQYYEDKAEWYDLFSEILGCTKEDIIKYGDLRVGQYSFDIMGNVDINDITKAIESLGVRVMGSENDYGWDYDEYIK